MNLKKFFVKNYRSCWKFLNETRWFVVFAIGVFALTFLIGFVFPIFFREQIIKFIAQMVKALKGKSAIEIILFIFLNNMRASFFAIILGVGFGIFPFMALVINGYLLGFVLRESAIREGIFIAWKLLPHGIFELPAVLFSIGIGMKIGKDLFRKDSKEKLKYNFKEGMRFFIFVVFPLLLVAGIIEGTLVWFGI